MNNKNIHIHHVEDLVLLEGMKGVLLSVCFLEKILNHYCNVTIKYDGSPSLIAGIHPETKRFFIGTKSVFNITEPKINYTEEDINRNHSGRLAEILKISLKYLSKLNIEGVIQGDLLYVRDELKEEIINNISYITFKPNTITYAIPKNSKLADRVIDSELGIVFHTSYIGDSFCNLSATYKPICLNDISSVMNISPFMEYVEFGNEVLNEVEEIHERISFMNSEHIDFVVNYFSQFKNGFTLRSFCNYCIKSDKEITVDNFIEYVNIWWNKEIDSVKTIKSKMDKENKKNDIIDMIKSNFECVDSIFNFQMSVVKIKESIIRKLNSVQLLECFIETPEGYNITSSEGFVVSSDIGVVKLVDRNEFSKNNLNSRYK